MGCRITFVHIAIAHAFRIQIDQVGHFKLFTSAQATQAGKVVDELKLFA